MRVHEIITEQEKLDEVIPLIGIGLWQLIQWGLTIWSATMIYDVAKSFWEKTGGDLSKLTEDDWWDITIALGLLLATRIPGGARFIKSKFAKATPQEKAKVVNFIKPKVSAVFKQKSNAARGAIDGAGGTAGIAGYGISQAK
jgi:hypothetical protein